MKNTNKPRDFILSGLLLVTVGVVTIMLEKVFFTINPVITLDKTPIIFWTVVSVEIISGLYLFYIGIKK